MNPIDMEKIPVPDIIEPLDFEKTFQQYKDSLISLDPTLAPTLELESEPLVKLLQTAAYRKLINTAEINDATRANMLASAKGNDLAAIAARFNIERLVVQAEDLSTVPPTLEVLESDNSLLRRTQQAFDGLSTAGSIDGYVFHTLGSDGQVRDASAYSPQPTEMVITVLAHANDGTASASLLSAVRGYFGVSPDGLEQSGYPSKIRPEGDRLTIQSAKIINYQISAQIVMPANVTQAEIMAAAHKEISEYVEAQRSLGAGATLSGIHHALHQSGVSNVIISSPTADIVASIEDSAFCTQISLSLVLESSNE